MGLKRHHSFAGVIAAAVFTVIFGFQNCSDVDFKTSDDLLSRQYSFQPALFEERPAIKVDAILDNSNSMTYIQQQVSNALGLTVGVFSGFDGEYTAYTTTQTGDGELLSSEIDEIVYQVETEDGEIFTYDSEEEAEIKKEELADTEYKYHEVTRWKIRNPFGETVTFSKDLELTDFGSITNQIKDLINSDNIGTEGSSNEMGLCTLLRNIEANRGSNDFHTYIIATNEDDVTPEDLSSGALANCLLERKVSQENQQFSNGVTEVCDPATSDNCQSEYFLTRQRSQHLDMKFRYTENTASQARGELNSRIHRTNARYRYRNYKAQGNIKFKKYNYQIRYYPKINIDGIIEPAANRTTVNKAVNGSGTGACPTNHTNWVSCDSLAHAQVNLDAFIGQHDGNNYVCEMQCNNSQSGNKHVYLDSAEKHKSDRSYYPGAPAPFASTAYNPANPPSCADFAANELLLDTSGNLAVKGGVSGTAIDPDDIATCSFSYWTSGWKNKNGTQTQWMAGSCADNNLSGGWNNCSNINDNVGIVNIGELDLELDGAVCQNYCTSTLKTKTKGVAIRNGGDFCPGMTVDDEGTVGGESDPGDSEYIACTTSEKQTVLNDINDDTDIINAIAAGLNDGNPFGIDDISCYYTCSQDIRNATGNSNQRLVDAKTSCTDGSKNYFQDDSGTPGVNEAIQPCLDEGLGAGKHVQSCYTECDNNSQRSCNFSNDDFEDAFGGMEIEIPGSPNPQVVGSHNACNLTAEIINEFGLCGQDNEYEQLQMNQCAQEGPMGPGTNFWYQTTSPQVSFEQDLVDYDKGIVETVTERLKEVHGNNFFLVSFINPVKDADKGRCSTEELEKYNGFSESAKYQAIVDELGAKRAVAVPACLDDYTASMAFIFDLIVTQANRSYRLDLDLEKGEYVRELLVEDLYGLQYPLKPSQYDINNGLITFDQTLDLTKIRKVVVDIEISNPFEVEELASEEDPNEDESEADEG